MRGRLARNAVAVGGAVAVALVLAGCSQPVTEDDGAQGDLKILARVAIDENGAEIRPPDVAAAADPAGDGSATCAPVSIAMAGALTGPDSALGINIRNGVQLAVDKHNESNAGCQVQLRIFDTEGDPQKASVIAPQIVDDQRIVGLVGPAFSGETKSTGGLFSRAGLVTTTASATNVTLSENGWRTFFRGLGNDGSQGQAVANYLRNTLGHQKVCVVDDSTDYGLGLAQVVRETLGPVADAACNISIKKGDKDFAAVINQIRSAAPSSVFFSGYYPQAARFVQQLRDGGIAATFVSADGSKDPELIKQAGAAAADAVLSCPCSPAPDAFAEEYRQKFDQDPGSYSTEGYDLGTILLQGIDSGAVTRPALLEYVRNYRGPGVARNYQWSPTGELTDTLIWIYEVR